ncbi:GTPase Cwf10 [Schizosaccharomyces japonicus yFS275]|uniref:GTPase Cwf10 n=1 Tax=Schizosaccharomyces japonicus (strain yFS275 / FY16936) TaxID=402676 RepID=B6JVK1_SCHJY|nr:GTPase Cwf10 [Schizosaccharomyces japonicus yFS275]EEB05402.1 GTPase Cwf10 [Schizosaccharomyces japonicus yFS275]
MDEELYDEFGNYIGPEEDEDLESYNAVAAESVAAAPGFEEFIETEEQQEQESAAIDEEYRSAEGTMALDVVPPVAAENAVVLHEDKSYYPSAANVYGEDVDVMVQEEDTQPLTEPIVAPIREKRFAIETTNVPECIYKKEFLRDVLCSTDDVRTFAVVGHLHHGKTSLIDLLVRYTHIDIREPKTKSLRYTDTHYLERERVMSIKSTPMTLLATSSQQKSYAFQCIDTPGHVDFVDEVATTMAVSDGVVLVVDVIEGVMINTRRIIKHAVLQNMPIVVVLNKIDRLILELRLPPADAYFKIKHTIDEVNHVIHSVNPDPTRRVSPELGNVCFASSELGYCFTLFSFAKMYVDEYGKIDIEQFGKRLWGDIFFDKQLHKFVRKTNEQQCVRSFVHFILEPLYKLHSHTLSDEPARLKSLLAKFRIYLKKSDYELDPQPLLRLVCSAFFGFPTGFVDAVVKHIPCPREAAAQYIPRRYTGPLDGDPIGRSLVEMNRSTDAPLVMHVTKLYTSVDANSFYALARIYSGQVVKGQKVCVLGENYSVDDEEDMVHATVTEISIPCARYRLPIEGATAGMLVFLSGVDNSISKSATVVSEGIQSALYVFSPVVHFTDSVFKVAIEPHNPSELPKMLDGLRKVNKVYPLAITKVEESGEHTVYGTGEMYMDCLLYDLRFLFSEIEIKVSDPVARFCETAVETSSLKCFAETPNKKNRISMVVEPLDKGIADEIEQGHVNLKWPTKEVGKFFQENYSWDFLASRSIWAFGPGDCGPNILRNDTLLPDEEKPLLNSVKDYITQGFRWGTQEGPLCDEAIRNVNFRILDVTLASEALYRGGGQIIPTARRVCYSSFLMGSPRLMEPVYHVEIYAPADSLPVIYNVVSRRRGHVVKDEPKPGSTLYLLEALLPVIDSCGFESDLRVQTQGQAMCQQVFDHWQVVPGDPLDKSIKMKPLEAAHGPALARDFLVKTRRRKGLVEDVSVTKYFDQEMIDSLKDAGIVSSFL